MDLAWPAVDHLPHTGVQISVMVFGGLTLLIFAGGLFLSRRRQHRPAPPPTSRILTDLIFAQKAHRGFGAEPMGQAKERVANPDRPDIRTGGVNT